MSIDRMGPNIGAADDPGETTAPTLSAGRAACAGESTAMIGARNIYRTANPVDRGTRWLRRGAFLGLALSAPLAPVGCTASVQLGPQTVAGLTPDGTVNMDQVQVAYIGSAGGGSGTLYYQGAAYPFRVGGLGVGGIGASTISVEGEVCKLGNLASFSGTYGQARYGFAVGTQSGGDL